MTERVLYWWTIVFAGAAFLLFVANACLINGNQAMQAEIQQKQTVINTANRVMPLNQQLSNALYDAVLKGGDAKIRDLLIAQGFKLPEKASAPAAGDKAAKAKKVVKTDEE